MSVRDTGPGIPTDQLERVFERFYQVKGDRPAAMAEEPGIGLALARQLVELHGGTIAVESAEGEGACFTVTLGRDRDQLPADLLDEKPGSARSGRWAPSPSPRRPRTSRCGRSISPTSIARTTARPILVVDDHPDVRAYVRRHLEPDYRMLEAATASRGWSRRGASCPTSWSAT